ncbi:hypothetical protein [Ilumatobacter sp.]|uniref:hypothetical protein n=1 Tax=Ilumatobacter sp. TaxID=1967498 RepID=UPI003B52EA0D
MREHHDSIRSHSRSARSERAPSFASTGEYSVNDGDLSGSTDTFDLTGMPAGSYTSCVDLVGKDMRARTAFTTPSPQSTFRRLRRSMTTDPHTFVSGRIACLPFGAGNGVIECLPSAEVSITSGLGRTGT